MKFIVQALMLLVCSIPVFGVEIDPTLQNPDPLAGEIPAYTPFLDDDFADEVHPEPVKQEEKQQVLVVPRDQTRVAVLGYHNFSKTAKVSEMLMRTSDLRKQMEYIRKAGLTVISMQEFLEWRFGTRELPAKCVLITLDDGWRSVYTDAYPIFKEFGYPFHLFLYTRYLTGLGDSMSPAMIREMMKNGASIGNHSTSHLYPRSWKAAQAKGEETIGKLVDAEIGEAFKKLTSLFGPVNTYCYPGGFVMQPMLDRLPGYGCVAAFTVLPGKVTVSEDPLQIHRYMVFGNNHSIFKSAMDFRVAQLGTAVTTGSQPGTLPSDTPVPPFPVHPKANETTTCDFGVISADLSGVAGVDFSTVHMKVSGFARVPATVDRATRTVQWTPPCRIYMPHLSVHVTWKSTDGSSHKAEWSFSIDPYATAQQ